ncbi:MULTISPECIES: hypothetical protein [unclassified Moorena]|uniref:hypothetical protein n=1 Tax=unclassified Moorena TaxID=2683338 RepID=UPI001418758A|nr:MULTISPECIES: hypothetical protein [unclassified Moorena]NEO13890.1 hypothetical protein [Moorena sp. SIO3E8]
MSLSHLCQTWHFGYRKLVSLCATRTLREQLSALSRQLKTSYSADKFNGLKAKDY